MNDRPKNEGTAAYPAAVRWTRGALTALVSIVMFAMMMITTTDVAGRALLNLPIKGSDEIISFLLAIVIFAALPLISWDEKHITVNLFERWIGGWVQRALAVLLSAVSTVVVGVVTYRMWTQARLMAEGQHITGALEWPIAPVVYFMCILAGLTTLILVIVTWRKLTGREAPHLTEFDADTDIAEAE